MSTLGETAGLGASSFQIGIELFQAVRPGSKVRIQKPAANLLPRPGLFAKHAVPFRSVEAQSKGIVPCLNFLALGQLIDDLAYLAQVGQFQLSTLIGRRLEWIRQKDFGFGNLSGTAEQDIRGLKISMGTAARLLNVQRPLNDRGSDMEDTLLIEGHATGDEFLER